MANKIEKQIIEQINRADHLNEGFLSSAFIKVMFSKKAKKAFKKTGKEMKKDKTVTGKKPTEVKVDPEIKK